MAKKNTTSAGGYKAGGGSQAKAQKSPKTKGLSPMEIAMLGVSFTPAGRAASAAGKVATTLAKGKYVEKAGKTVSKTVTQGKNAKVTTTPPKSTKSGPSSPVKGTQVNVTRTKKSQSPAQQASVNEGRKARGAAKAGVYLARGYTAKMVEERSKDNKKK